MPSDRPTPRAVIIDEPGHRAYEQLITRRMPEADPATWALFTFTLGAGRRAEALLADVARPYGLDGSQFSVLAVLWMSGPPHRLSPTQLSRNIAQSPSGMTHTVKRLTANGLVQRVGLASDGRAKHVELTEEGRRVVSACAAEMAKVAEATFRDDGLAPADLAVAQRQIVAALTKKDPRANA